MARVFLYGAYKYPRELNWIIGFILLILGMFEGFTGYLLPYDQTAYWATVVGMNITANGPFVGTLLGQIMQGGPAIGQDTLSRFYSLHMLVAPGLIFALIGLHLYLVIRLGVSSPPWSKDAAGRERDEEPQPEARTRPGRADHAREARAVISKPSPSLQARRAEHARYKEDVKKRGSPSSRTRCSTTR